MKFAIDVTLFLAETVGGAMAISSICFGIYCFSCWVSG
jgi:hypothetical protein